MIKSHGNTYPEKLWFEFYYNDIPIGRFKAEDEGDFISIWNLSIDKEFRNKGFGKQLMSELVDYFRNLGVSKLWLCVSSNNIPAQKIYETSGFIYEKNNIQSIKTMVKIL